MISIVIPARNEGKHLADCLSSLQHQDYTGEYEIIVADNASTDNTLDIARSFGVRVVSCPEKKSVAHARQCGADAARGEIIAQADADTIYPRFWLKKLADQLSAHPEAVAISGRYFYKDRFTWARLEYALRYCLNRLSAVLLGRPMLVSGATFAFYRQAFLAVNGYRGLSYSADQYGISSRLSKLGKVLYDKNLYVFTSARSVQKPLIVIMMDILVHTSRWLLYFAKGYASELLQAINRTRTRRLITRLAPVPTLAIMLVAYGYFIPSSPVFGKIYSAGSPIRNVVALTFDDGPNEPYTSEILDILNRYDIKATFFIIGKNAELYPETARRIVAEGDVVGNHSYSHDANGALSDFGAKDLERAEGAILNNTGVSPHLYRPPHGKKTPWELAAVRKDGLIEVVWSVSANDQHVFAFWGTPTPEFFAQEIVKATKPGGIILLHDGYGTTHNNAQADRSLTIKALPLIIEQLKAKGYSFVTVPELLGVPAYLGAQ
jgi:peptidoglycan/xylan/chitin deacetylase (PgdA/CDA1 family)